MSIRFFAFLESLDVALMAIDNKRRTKEGTDRGDVGEMKHVAWCDIETSIEIRRILQDGEIENHGNEGKKEDTRNGDDGAKGDFPGEMEENQEEGDADDKENRRDKEDVSCDTADSLSAFEVGKDREGVSKKDGDGRKADEKLIDVTIWDKNLMDRAEGEDKKDDHERNIGFQHIQDHGGDTGLLAKRPTDVGPSGIAGAKGTDVDAMNPSDDDAGRNRPKEIA